MMLTDVINYVFSPANLISSMIAGLITSGILWLFFFLRNMKLRNYNYEILMANAYYYIVLFNGYPIVLNELLSSIEKIRQRADVFKYNPNAPNKMIIEDIVDETQVLKNKLHWIDNKLYDSLDFIKNVEISLLKHSVRCMIMEPISDAISLRALAFGSIERNQIDLEYSIVRRDLLSRQQQLEKEIHEVGEKIKSLEKSEDQSDLHKVSQLKQAITDGVQKFNTEVREKLMSVVETVDNVVADTRISLAAKRRDMVKIEKNLRKIIKELPAVVRREIKELTARDLDEHFDIVSGDPLLARRKEFASDTYKKIFGED